MLLSKCSQVSLLFLAFQFHFMVTGGYQTSGCYDIGYEYALDDYLENSLVDKDVDGLWHDCEFYCGETLGCNYFTWVQGSCFLLKEERDKLWPQSAVYQKPAKSEAECVKICARDPECNIGFIYKKNQCKLKKRNTPIDRVVTDHQVVSGPALCPGLNANIDMKEILEEIQGNNCPPGYEQRGDFCYMISFERKTQPEAEAECQKAGPGGHLAMPKTREQNLNMLSLFCPKFPDDVGKGASKPVVPTDKTDKPTYHCNVPRGANLDGVYFIGLVAHGKPGLDLIAGEWKWADGTDLNLNEHHWAGQDGNTPIYYVGYPTIQPDNTSGRQFCAYFYPRNSDGSPSGNWGDEDCFQKCLYPAQDWRSALMEKCYSKGSAGYWSAEEAKNGKTNDGVQVDMTKTRDRKVGKLTGTPRRYICQIPAKNSRELVLMSVADTKQKRNMIMKSETDSTVKMTPESALALQATAPTREPTALSPFDQTCLLYTVELMNEDIYYKAEVGLKTCHGLCEKKNGCVAFTHMNLPSRDVRIHLLARAKAGKGYCFLKGSPRNVDGKLSDSFQYTTWKNTNIVSAMKGCPVPV